MVQLIFYLWVYKLNLKKIFLEKINEFYEYIRRNYCIKA